jgi:hypothetical protein
MVRSAASFDPPHPEELGRRPSVSKDEAARRTRLLRMRAEHLGAQPLRTDT